MESQDWLETPIWYEDECISSFVPEKATCKYLRVPERTPLEDVGTKLQQALDSPLQSPSLQELVANHYTNGKPLTVIIDDDTRPNIHTRAILPILSEKLMEFGVAKSDIRIGVATGTHTPPTPTQVHKRILQDLYDEWKDQTWVHDCDDEKNHDDLGFSPSKTPIFIDKRVLSSCLMILLSDSEYHYFAGVAGSVKQFVPGLCARKTVRVNHSRIFDLETGFKMDCRMGNVENNICIQDIRDILRILMQKCAILVIDAIMHKGRLVDVFAGSPIAIHNNALKTLSHIRDVKIHEKADLVIVAKPSVNFYQMGKGLNAASHAVKKGGKIVVLGACTDGIGPEHFLEAMKAVKHLPNKEAMHWIIKNKCTESTFEIGIQNAVDLFRILQFTEGQIFVYTELNPQLMKETFRVNSLDTTKSPQEALREFILRFLANQPKGMIHVFEDFNLLTVT